MKIMDACKSAVGVVHGVDVVVCHVVVHLEVDHLHHFWVPVAGSLKNVIDWQPGIDEDGLFDYRQFGTACATG